MRSGELLKPSEGEIFDSDIGKNRSEENDACRFARREGSHCEFQAVPYARLTTQGFLKRSLKPLVVET